MQTLQLISILIDEGGRLMMVASDVVHDLELSQLLESQQITAPVQCLRCVSAEMFSLSIYCNTHITFPQYLFPAAGMWQIHDSLWWKRAELPSNESVGGVSLFHLCFSCRDGPSCCSFTEAIKYSSKAELNRSTLVFNHSLPVHLHRNIWNLCLQKKTEPKQPNESLFSYTKDDKCIVGFCEMTTWHQLSHSIQAF